MVLIHFLVLQFYAEIGQSMAEIQGNCERPGQFTIENAITTVFAKRGTPHRRKAVRLGSAKHARACLLFLRKVESYSAVVSSLVPSSTIVISTAQSHRFTPLGEVFMTTVGEISKARQERVKLSFEQIKLFINLDSDNFQTLPDEKKGFLYLPSVGAFSASADNTSVFLDKIFDALTSFSCVTEPLQYAHAYVTTVHANLLDNVELPAGLIESMTRERASNLTPTRLWVAFHLEQCFFVAPDKEGEAVVIIVHINIEKDYRVPGDNRPTCTVVQVGFVSQDSIIESREPNEHLQYTIEEIVSSSLRVQPPGPAWSFFENDVTINDESKDEYLWSMEYRRLVLQYQGCLFVRENTVVVSSHSGVFRVLVILGLDESAENVCSIQLEQLKMSALTTPLVINRLNMTGESKVLEYNTDRDAFERNNTTEVFKLQDILRHFVNNLRQESENQTATTLLMPKGNTRKNSANTSVHDSILSSVVSTFVNISKENEVICATCLEGHSSKGNEIILCDECDKGYHQTCVYPLLNSIPRGNWYCDKCTQSASGDKRCISSASLSTADTSKRLKQQISLVVEETEESAMDTDSTPPNDPLDNYEVGKKVKACLNCTLPDGDAVSIGTEGIVIEIVSVSKKTPMIRVKWSTIGNSVGLYKAYGLYSKGYTIQSIS